jgi:hypothetical protein
MTVSLWPLPSPAARIPEGSSPSELGEDVLIVFEQRFALSLAAPLLIGSAPSTRILQLIARLTNRRSQ